jgi:hypothetical protein
MLMLAVAVWYRMFLPDTSQDWASSILKELTQAIMLPWYD